MELLLFDQMKNKFLQNPKLRVIFSQIRESIHTGLEDEIYIYYESKIIELLYAFSELNRAASFQRYLSNNDMNAVEKTKLILGDRFSDAPTIAQLAVLTGTSQAKLQRDFKAVMGHTIHDYLQAVRMARALDMIERTENPLYVIAKEAGFNHPGRFAEVFKNVYGVNPDLYRRQFNQKVR
jgi:AraC-like DNA-binding protein